MNGTMSQLSPRNVNVFLQPLPLRHQPLVFFLIMSYDVILGPTVWLLLSNILTVVASVPLLKFVLCTPMYIQETWRALQEANCKMLLSLSAPFKGPLI